MRGPTSDERIRRRMSDVERESHLVEIFGEGRGDLFGKVTEYLNLPDLIRLRSLDELTKKVIYEKMTPRMVEILNPSEGKFLKQVFRRIQFKMRETSDWTEEEIVALGSNLISFTPHWRESKITDEGLSRLDGLTSLDVLGESRITDEYLERLVSR